MSTEQDPGDRNDDEPRDQRQRPFPHPIREVREEPHATRAHVGQSDADGDAERRKQGGRGFENVDLCDGQRDNSIGCSGDIALCSNAWHCFLK